MPQTQIQEQRQEQRLAQNITQQQLLLAQLVELPIAQFAERVETEMHDNPALEQRTDDEEPRWDEPDDVAASPADDGDDYDRQREREERDQALDEALQGIGRDDEDLPVYQGGSPAATDREEMVYGEALSFYDQLLEQMAVLDLSPRDRDIMEYLIRSLDDDGLLRTSLDDLAEVMAFRHNLDATPEELARVLQLLQTLDPPGIGARSLQECLLLQIDRRPPSPLREQMRTVVEHYFDEFTKKHWDRIRQALGLGEVQAQELQHELRRLNPKPGASMGETVGRSLQQITPDFIVDTQDDGTVTFTLSSGDLPQLQVSQSFADLLRDYRSHKDHLSRQMKEALLYTKKKVEAAQNFIDAMEMRRRTLTKTMKAIIEWQHRFFEEGDEALLRPMILKDVAAKTGLDLSTISRVSNSKYALTRWGTFPLRYFFSDGYRTDSGEELSTREIKAALRDLIAAEDKKHPLSDDALSTMLAAQGYPIARRTVAKYREQLGLPVARLRKS